MNVVFGSTALHKVWAGVFLTTEPACKDYKLNMASCLGILFSWFRGNERIQFRPF